MSHFSSFINAPFRADRGKRHIEEPVNYKPSILHEREENQQRKSKPGLSNYDTKPWDFLKDDRPEQEKKIPNVGVPSNRESKFKTGFYRRPIHKIQPEREREMREENKEQQFANHWVNRRDWLVANAARNGDVIKPPEQEVQDPLFARRRHYSPDAIVNQQAGENARRQREGASRFHQVLSAEAQQRRDERNAARVQHELSLQSTSVLGFGRPDLPSKGVLDAFATDYQYKANEIQARRSKAAPRIDDPTIRHRLSKNASSVVLADASTLDLTEQLYAKQRQQQQQKHAASNRTLRGNASSIELQQSLKHDWHQHNHVTQHRQRNNNQPTSNSSSSSSSSTTATTSSSIFGNSSSSSTSATTSAATRYHPAPSTHNIITHQALTPSHQPTRSPPLLEALTKQPSRTSL